MNPAAEPKVPSTVTESDPATLSAESLALTAEQLAELTDEGKQAEYQRQFSLQQQRRACPGCGDL